MPKESDCINSGADSTITRRPFRRLIQREKDVICDHIEIIEKFLCLWKPLFFKAEFVRFSNLRLFFLRLLKFTGDLVLVLRDFPMVKVFLLESEIGRVVFVGREIEEFKYLFCPCNPITSIDSFSIWSWELPSKTAEWLSCDIEMVVHGVSRFFPWRAKTAYYTTTPKWLSQVFVVPEDCEEPPSGKRMRQLRKIYRDNGHLIDYHFSRDVSEFDHFYHHMYVPYVSNRHGEFVYVETYDYLYKWFLKGGLVVVTYDGKSIAGLLCAENGDCMFAAEIGLLDGDPKLHEEGFSRVAYWSTVQYAHEHGCKYFQMGGSYSIRSNGVFNFKSTCWYSFARDFYFFIRNDWRFYLQQPSHQFLDYLNQWGIIHKGHNNYYAVIFDDGENKDSDNLDEAVKKAYSDGLDGIVHVMPGNNEYIPYSTLHHQNPTQDWIHMGRN